MNIFLLHWQYINELQKIPFFQPSYCLVIHTIICIPRRKRHENIQHCTFFWIWSKTVLKTSKNTSSSLNQRTVVTVAYNSNSVPSYLTEQELVQCGWKSFTCCCFAKFLWKVFLSKLSIIAKTVEKIVLPNSSPTSLCHKPCFSKYWVIQMWNI